MSDDYDVGYGKPPKHGQFKPGQSGNPHGRPSGTKNLKTDLTEELGERIQIHEGGRAVNLSKQRALVKSLTAKALTGDMRAATLVLNMIWRLLETDPAEDLPMDLSAEDVAILESFIKRQTRSSSEGDRS